MNSSRPRAWKVVPVATLVAVATLAAALTAAGIPEASATRTLSSVPVARVVSATSLPAVRASVEAKTYTSSEVSLSKAMRSLWEQHMEWTYATVAAFAAGSKGFNATLARLLQNQTDLGNAIKPYYGGAAGHELSVLLHHHILGYVPVLEDAKAGDTTGATKAFDAVLANGIEIGKFLHGINPRNWSAQQVGQMMTIHNKQTLQYAADQLEGKYGASIAEYGRAEAHMMQMADMLTAGIIAQFPNRFKG